MRQMLLMEQGKPLQMSECDIPSLEPDQVVLKVSACVACRTNLHVVEVI